MRKTTPLAAAVVHLAIFAALCLGYTTYITRLFDDMGFVDDVSAFKMLVGGLAIVLLCLIVPNVSTPSTLFLHFMLATVVTPCLVFMAGANLPIAYGIVCTGGFLIIAAITLLTRNIPLPNPCIQAEQLLLILAGVSVLTVIVYGATGGYGSLNFDFSRVYELRHSTADAVPGMFGYIEPIVTKALVPFGIVIGFALRRYGLCATFMGCAVFLGAMSNHKAPFFFPALVLGTMWVASRRQPALSLLLMIAAFVIIGVGLALLVNHDELGPPQWFANLGIRRFLMVPALLNYFYWDFFSENPMYLWSESRVSMGITDNPYGIRSTHLIGVEYFRAQEMGANTGWLGSGMAQAGYFGVVIYSMLIGVLLVVMDGIAERLGVARTTAIFIVPVSVFAGSSELLTTLLTHGLAVLLVMSCLVSVPRREGGFSIV